jgi:hypothetical protein
VRRSVAVGLAAAVVVAACARPPLPVRLAGLHRTRVWTGERATRLIAQLHGSDVAPGDSIVADYGARGELRVYLSHFPDDSEAVRVLGRMIGDMRAGGTRFTPPHQDAGDSGRWLTFGPGGHQALWVSKGRLYWLQGSPEAVQQAAAELPPPAAGSWT